MAETPHVGLTLLEQSQAQKEITVNEALYRLDALLNSGAIDRDLATPPLSPAAGDVYLVAATGTDEWTGKSDQIAYFDQIWRFIEPNEGMMLWVNDEDVHLLYNGTSWQAVDHLADMQASVYDPAAIAQQVVGLSATQMLSNKTLSSPVVTGNPVGMVTMPCQGRLTLTSNTPVTSSDVTAAATLYFTPHGGNQIALYNGSNWVLYAFSQLSLAVPATTSTLYDMWVYDNSGSLTLEATAWTNDTTRATALAVQDGIYVKGGAPTRRYVGSFRTTGISGQTEDSKLKRYVWNYYNRLPRMLAAIEATASWTYSSTSWQQANASSANQVDFVIGVSEDIVSAVAVAQVKNSTSTARVVYAGIGLDSTTTPAGRYGIVHTASIAYKSSQAYYDDMVSVGRHYLAWLEQGAGVDTQTWLGNARFGIVGRVVG